MAPVWMSIALDDDGFGSPAMRGRCEAFERTVEEMLTASRAGQLDGNEIGRGEWRLMLVGKNERRLREIAAEAVTAAPGLSIAIEPPPPRAKTAIRRGMVFRIPVAGGWAYAQFVGHDPQDEMGDMLIVFDQITTDPCPVEQIDTSRIMFGPVFAAWRYLV